ncbi:MAG: helix-turn-helix domain-containing protein [Planctomycetes bacterium]|nr:helix-turn-helix domain-containing protein [Planctomycetota bacterium]
MKKELFAPPPPVIEPLALRPGDAARALGISERLLWDWAHQHGLPYVQVGRVVAYPVAELRTWLRERSRNDLPEGQSSQQSICPDSVIPLAPSA